MIFVEINPEINLTEAGEEVAGIATGVPFLADQKKHQGMGRSTLFCNAELVGG